MIMTSVSMPMCDISTVLTSDTLVVYLFSPDTLQHDQPDAWPVSQLLVLVVCGHVSDETCDEMITKCTGAGGPPWV